MEKKVLLILALIIASPIAAFAQNDSAQSNLGYTKSPLKQFLGGTAPEDVVCQKELVLIIKASNGNPACVKESTAEKLAQLGWALKTTQQKSGTWVPQEETYQEAVPSSIYPGPTAGVPRQEESLGFSVGGSKDVNNFRENIENDFLPLPTDITYEGLFYDYFFDTGKILECEKLFCPSYSYAISKDPFSKKDDYYLSVGLNSGLKQEDFQRKKLNLVIVLDVSGSMSSPFDEYYYDQFGNQIPRESQNNDDFKSKMALADESVAGLIDHLNDDDNLGIVLFTDSAYAAKPLESMKITDKQSLKDNILEIYATSGTNMEAGMDVGTSLFDNATDTDPTEYENRIIFLTDAMPNLGDTSDTGLLGMIEKNAQNSIYTTFIGIGVDLNTELVEKLTKVRGSNYYSVHSSDEFKQRMVEEFDYMVTPLVFNLTLNLDADGYDIKQVYGSPEANEATGEIMKVNTLFPSKTVEGQTRGGIVLLKLEKTSDNGTLVLKTTYENSGHQTDGDSVTVVIDKKQSDYYENSGIRKAVLLSQYADLMKTWIFDERRAAAENTPITYPTIVYDDGIHVPEYVKLELGQWERQSLPLKVSKEYDKLIADFNEYFKQEATLIGDDSLMQETKIMTKLANHH